jgi:hypothetical protein
VLLLVKVRNAGELLWESLDSRERMLLVYACAWIGFVAVLSAQRRSRERFRQSIVDEVTNRG